MGDLSTLNLIFSIFLFTFIPNFGSGWIVEILTIFIPILLIVKFFTNLDRKLYRFKAMNWKTMEKGGCPPLVPLLGISVIIVGCKNFLKTGVHRFCASAVLKPPDVGANLSVCPHFLLISIHFHFLLGGLGWAYAHSPQYSLNSFISLVRCSSFSIIEITSSSFASTASRWLIASAWSK